MQPNIRSGLYGVYDKLMRLLNLANDIAGENRQLILGDFNVPFIDWKNVSLT